MAFTIDGDCKILKKPRYSYKPMKNLKTNIFN